MFCQIHKSSNSNIYKLIKNKDLLLIDNQNVILDTNKPSKILIDNFNPSSYDRIFICDSDDYIKVGISPSWVKTQNINIPLLIILPSNKDILLPGINSDITQDTMSLCQDNTRITKLPYVSINIENFDLINNQWRGHNHVWTNVTHSTDFSIIAYSFLYIFNTKISFYCSILHKNPIDTIDLYGYQDIECCNDENGRIDCNELKIDISNIEVINNSMISHLNYNNNVVTLKYE